MSAASSAGYPSASIAVTVASRVALPPSYNVKRSVTVASFDAADLYERANGRLFKEVEVALPVELAPD